MRKIIVDIVNQINKSNDIALYCHTNPDGDALCSILSLYVAIKKMGKSVVAYCDSEIPKRFECLQDYQDITYPQKCVHELAIALDCSEIDRLGLCQRSFLSSKYRIAIDHHKTFQKFANINFVDATASSCCEIVFDILQEMNIIDCDIAKLLFGGIVTDSGCFSLPCVTHNTFEKVAELSKYNIDMAQIVYDLYKSSSPNKFQLKARAMRSAKFFENNQIGIMIFTSEDFDITNTTFDESEGIVNELMNVSTIKVAYSLSQVHERNFKMSIRTKNDVDASEIASIFGGGGHKNAGGCRVNGYIEDIIEKLVKIAKDRI